MPLNNFFGLRSVPRLPDSSDIECSILPRETAHATHVVPIVCKLAAGEAILGSIGEHGFGNGESMEIVALVAVGTASSRKEEAAVLDAGRVGSREARVPLDVASRLRLDFTVQRMRGSMSTTKQDTHFE